MKEDVLICEKEWQREMQEDVLISEGIISAIAMYSKNR